MSLRVGQRLGTFRVSTLGFRDGLGPGKLRLCGERRHKQNRVVRLVQDRTYHLVLGKPDCHPTMPTATPEANGTKHTRTPGFMAKSGLTVDQGVAEPLKEVKSQNLFCQAAADGPWMRQSGLASCHHRSPCPPIGRTSQEGGAELSCVLGAATPPRVTSNNPGSSAASLVQKACVKTRESRLVLEGLCVKQGLDHPWCGTASVRRLPMSACSSSCIYMIIGTASNPFSTPPGDFESAASSKGAQGRAEASGSWAPNQFQRQT